MLQGTCGVTVLHVSSYRLFGLLQNQVLLWIWPQQIGLTG